jgi:hypothetical protein
MHVLNRLYGTEPVILHAAGPLNLSPLWSIIEGAVFAADPPRRPGARDDYTFFTWNSGARRSHDKAKRLGTAERCLRWLEVPHEVLGHGMNPWTNILKISTLQDALRRVTTPYVIACDSADVLILGDPARCVDLFEQQAADLLYIGDSSFWPPELESLKLQEEAVPGAQGTRFPYLNAGALIGRTPFCRDLFNEAAELARPQVGIPRAPGTSGAGTSDDDQSIMKRLYLAHHPRVQLDFRCQIFQPLTYQDRHVLRLVKDQRESRWRRALSMSPGRPEGSAR